MSFYYFLFSSGLNMLHILFLSFEFNFNLRCYNFTSLRILFHFGP